MLEILENIPRCRHHCQLDSTSFISPQGASVTHTQGMERDDDNAQRDGHGPFRFLNHDQPSLPGLHQHKLRVLVIAHARHSTDYIFNFSGLCLQAQKIAYLGASSFEVSFSIFYFLLRPK